MRSSPAERVGWALRARACGFAAAPVEQGSKAHTTLGEKTKRPHKGAFLFSGGEGGYFLTTEGIRGVPKVL